MGVAVIMIAMHMIVVMMIVVTLMIVVTQFGGRRFIAMMFMILSVDFAVLMMIMFVMVMLVVTIVLGVLMRLLALTQIGARALDDGALHAIAMTAAAGIAVARPAAVGAVFALFLGLAMGAFVGFD